MSVGIDSMVLVYAGYVASKTGTRSPEFEDLEAAAIAADLWSRHKEAPKDQQYGRRQVLRADAMIVASVCAAGATEFYSHDRRCRALASLLMAARDLPTDDPEDMFLKDDIRRGDV